ncbi:aspartate aminotransferase, HisC in bacteria [Cyanidioschyzon merolae strain 10D]|jgi:aspartate aminotransferase|uniref:Aspartate aminotransferase, HisC in bacteria n=1 Tax=Cyanidioschyzon merolae (strain NIES-3377 / 10D) TaxID=280699 RepID=M1UQ18_CYAM1|nr:aspartate aminotransferase, HisC in bacteria [Cyanidioschyzon merolae strain 10D]BAM79591.1 aspartate aminotransferase, HisC in bacteria [Cyanidioschyzon merolae strain 10D]|eukprot:XP_005535877.1 aspartate aminotransferase, HisC in bacteria [Cyanidioschyzon merolae strain 10D]
MFLAEAVFRIRQQSKTISYSARHENSCVQGLKLTSEKPEARSTVAALSRRVWSLRDEGAYSILERANHLDRHATSTADKIIHLEIGQPSAAPPQHVVDALINAVQSGETKYTDPAGTLKLREAICAYIERTHQLKHGTLSPNMVVVGPGAKPGIALSCLALLEPGDEVLVPDPGFPAYRALIEVCGARAVTYTVSSEFGLLDPAEISAKITQKTKLLILNSPSNPTGGVLSPKTLKELEHVLKSCGSDIWILSDEIYARWFYEDRQIDDEAAGHVSIFCDDELRSRTILIDGLSKSFSMTGFRIGYAVAPAFLAERLRLLAVHIYGCVANFTQSAATTAFVEQEKSDAYIRSLIEMYRRNRDLTYETLSIMKGCYLAKPQGAFYAWLDVSAYGIPTPDLARYLLEHGRVAVLPGTDFGSQGEGFLRISFVCDQAELREGLGRLDIALRKIAPSGIQQKLKQN